MKKPDMCKINVEICENCRNWEPIPFHDDGGVCIPPMEVIMVKSAPPVIGKETEKVPVAV